MTFETSPLETFLAPKKPSGSERIAPITVPTQASWSDSTIPRAPAGR